MSMKATILLLTVAAVALVTLSACSSTASPKADGNLGNVGSATSSAASPSNTASATASAPATGPTDQSSPPPTSGTSAAIAKCTVGDLNVSQLPGNSGAAGTIVVAIQITNVSGHTCTVNGYPTFTLSHLGNGADTNEPVQLKHGVFVAGAFGAPVKTINVPAGGHSGFVLGYSQVPSGSGACAQANRMHLTLPDSGSTAAGSVNIPVCGSPMQVSPYVSPRELKP
jgi:hypothetical protein